MPPVVHPDTSSPHRPPQAAYCEGKERFESAVLANQVARRSMASKRARGKLDKPIGSYLCRACGGYHLGSTVTR